MNITEFRRRHITRRICWKDIEVAVAFFGMLACLICWWLVR